LDILKEQGYVFETARSKYIRFDNEARVKNIIKKTSGYNIQSLFSCYR
jgi:hypothetical protein